MKAREDEEEVRWQIRKEETERKRVDRLKE